MFKKKISKLEFVLTLLLALIGFSFSAQAETTGTDEPDQYVQLEVFTNKENVTGGETIRLAIEKNIYSGWHTYWLNPGDSGLPLSIEWNLPEGYQVSDLEWPTPKKIPYGELTNYGYEGRATLLQNLTVPDHISATPITISGKANLLVCHDICIPETHEVKVTLNSDTSFNPDKIRQAEKLLPVPLYQTASFYERDKDFIIDVKTQDTTMAADDIFIAPEEWGLIDNNATTQIEMMNTGFRLIQKRGERSLSEIENFPFVIASEDKKQSYRLVAAPSQKTALINMAPVNNKTKKESVSFIKAFIFALLGGLILNLMPCVFPVLSMKALSLVQLGDKEKGKARLYGLSYTAGIMLSFGLIAGILIALKTAGAQIGWGFQLQNPVVIGLLIYLIFIIGLNLAGFFEFKNSFGNVGQKLAGQSGNKGAFFTGVLATLVATPCTAPFMGVAMGYALTQGAFVSIVIFLTLGLGLALPYLALCFIPTLRTKLPKPGAWMERFKELLSFPMFLTAAYLVWVLSQQANSVSVLLILSALIAITFIIWLWPIKPRKGISRLISFITLILLIFYVICTPLTLRTSPQTGTITPQNEQAFDHAKLSELLKGDDPVFTNMTAAWCITCKVNERIALRTQDIQTLFQERNIQYLKGDWTNRNAEISEYLNSFDRQGVPLYVYYGPRDAQSGQRPEPIVLPQVLTPNIIKKTIQTHMEKRS